MLTAGSMKHIVQELNGFDLQPLALSQVVIFHKLILTVWDLSNLLPTILQVSHAAEPNTYSARIITFPS